MEDEDALKASLTARGVGEAEVVLAGWSGGYGPVPMVPVGGVCSVTVPLSGYMPDGVNVGYAYVSNTRLVDVIVDVRRKVRVMMKLGAAESDEDVASGTGRASDGDP